MPKVLAGEYRAAWPSRMGAAAMVYTARASAPQ